MWVIIVGIIAAVVVASITVKVSNRRQLSAAKAAELPSVEQTTSSESNDSESVESLESAGTVPAESVEALAAASDVSQVSTSDQESVDQLPEQAATRLARLRRRLSSSSNALARGLAQLLSVDRIDDDTWDDFETTLITSDLGVGPTTELVESLKRELAIDGVADPARAKQVLHDELVKLVDPSLDRSLHLDGSGGVPAVVMVVGVNGTGKTTTVGKLARVLVAEGTSVLLGAADTFRAAAAEQLNTWGQRVGVDTVRGAEGADPASVAFEAVDRGVRDGVDVVLVDTAGRLHTKTGLMDELGKVKRVIEKKAPVSEVLLVLDATTGQNGLTQARIFSEVVDVTGIVLTKLDGSAKGGIVVQVQRELGVPVKLIGLGEGADDLAPFEPEGFVAGLLGD